MKWEYNLIPRQNYWDCLPVREDKSRRAIQVGVAFVVMFAINKSLVANTEIMEIPDNRDYIIWRAFNYWAVPMSPWPTLPRPIDKVKHRRAQRLDAHPFQITKPFYVHARHGAAIKTAN